MRFMILIEADPASEAPAAPGAGLGAAMAAYQQALAQAGVLLDGAGLQPSAAGWRIDYARQRAISEGPFTGSADVIAGYALVEVRSRAEALEWSRRFPAVPGAGARLEVRELAGAYACPSGSAGTQSHRECVGDADAQPRPEAAGGAGTPSSMGASATPAGQA